MQEIFEHLEQDFVTISEEQKERIRKRISQILNYEPRVGILGKTGVGKSSLCNTLFGQDIFPINDIEGCTRNPQEVLLRVGSGGINLIDLPGAGENQKRDKEYELLYSKLLPELDLVLWLIKADDRALSSDEHFYKTIVKPHIKDGKPFIIVLSQADKIEPVREWHEELRIPSSRQTENLEAKRKSISDFFGLENVNVIPVSASEKYNLVTLVDAITYALPKEKKITFLKSVQNENRSKKAKKAAEKGFCEALGETIGGVLGGDSGKILGQQVGKVVDSFAKRLFKGWW